MKAFLEVNGVKYYDYDFIHNIKPSDWNYRSWNLNKVGSYIFNNSVLAKLQGTTPGLYNTTFIPQKGDDIYVAPKCKVNLQDLRKGYNIKRSPDDGVCNVFSDVSYHNCHYCKLVIIPSKNAVVAAMEYNDTSASALRYALSVFPDIASESIIQITDQLYFSCTPEPYVNLLRGKYTKPCIPIENVPINQDTELTFDALYLAYKAATVSYNSTDAEKNLIMALNILNNYNWREYPGTMTLLHCLTRVYSSIMSDIKSHRSKYSKTIQNLLSSGDNSMFISEKDYNMGARLIQTIMELKDKHIVTYPSIQRKLNNDNVPLYNFLSMYTVAVKVEPKSYEQYKLDNEKENN